MKSKITKPEPLQARLQKVMADSGLGSRRQLEARIAAGEIRVNGKPARLGQQVKAGDRIQLRGKPLSYQVTEQTLPARTLIYNKPEGELTTRSDPQGRVTVFDRLPKARQGRWIAVGRLDLNTTGLLLLTTDGELANRMMHPSSQVDREYACRVFGQVTANHLQQLRKGVELDDGMARFSDIQPAEEGADNKWFYVVIMEGRNREVRRLWESQGIRVSRLKRVRYGPAFLPKGLKTGQYRELRPKEHEILREDVGLSRRATGLKLQPMRSRRKR